MSRQVAISISDFSCPGCKELLYDPVSLPSCAHRFCKKCIETSEFRSEKPTGASFVCPSCRAPQALSASELHVDSFLRSFLEGAFPSEYEHRRRQLAAVGKWAAMQRENDVLKEKLWKAKQEEAAEANAMHEKLRATISKSVSEREELKKEMDLLRQSMNSNSLGSVAAGQKITRPQTRSDSVTEIVIPPLALPGSTKPRSSTIIPKDLSTTTHHAQQQHHQHIQSVPRRASLPPSALAVTASPPRTSVGGLHEKAITSSASPSTTQAPSRDRSLSPDSVDPPPRPTQPPQTNGGTAAAAAVGSSDDPAAERSSSAAGLVRRRSDFHAFNDEFATLEEVQRALEDAGLESSNLIIGVDYTKSNVKKGAKTFGGKSLHYIASDLTDHNPYEQVIQILGKTLEPFDDDNLIPVFGFGDTTTQDHSVFPFFRDRYARGFQEVLRRYRELTQRVTLSGPTNFAPLIEEAIQIVKDRGRCKYHILVIVADGQVTNLPETEEAIALASEYPLSIVMVGVGDGPWDTMLEFDDRLPQRKFDNFQFVDFHKEMRKKNPQAAFALAALMEIPAQFKAICKLGLLGKKVTK